MNNRPVNSRTWMLTLATILALILLVWAHSTVQIAADDEKPSTTATPPTVYLPHIQREQMWLKVGAVPDGVNLFYEVSICGKDGLAGANIGLYGADDIDAGPVTWQRQAGIGIADQVVSGVTFVPDSDCKVAYVASRTSGVWRGERDGNTWAWKRVDKGLDQSYVVLVNGNKLYAAGSYGVRYTSPLPTSDAASWAATNIPTTTYSLTAAQNSVLAAVWAVGIYEQGALGGNFGQLGTMPNPNVYDVAVNASSVIVAGTDHGIAYRQGDTWTQTDPPLNLTSFAVLAVGDRFYASHDGSGVLVSHDNGHTWLDMSAGLPKDSTFRVRGLSLSDKGRLYAATRAGVWVWSGTP